MRHPNSRSCAKGSTASATTRHPLRGKGCGTLQRQEEIRKESSRSPAKVALGKDGYPVIGKDLPVRLAVLSNTERKGRGEPAD
jgi:hypothetical protein